ncbi:unnamed protein product [Schistocephalus solidus]|uniref:C2H2-type domain-containing protein n=1 Tax=Schistocephalus solidus TaxID=70667 RepID=A0A183TSX3_SCHSO|nr:unnamed protein product [Schistocephalus solidus]
MVSTAKCHPVHRPRSPRTRTPSIREEFDDNDATLDVLGRAHRQHQDWFDDNDADTALLMEKSRLHKAYMDLQTDTTKAAFLRCHCPVQQPLWEMQNTWIIQKAEEIQGSVKTGSAIYEANRIAAAKVKRAARKSPAPRTNIVDAQALPTCPRCQRIFRAQIGLVGHLRRQCTNNPTIPISTSNSANPTSDSHTLTPGINSITPTIKETTSQYSSPVTFTTDATTNISDGDSLLNCSQCDRTFTSRIGLVGHLRIHRTETGEPVPGAPTTDRDRHLHCPLSSRTFNHRMGLFGLPQLPSLSLRIH